MSWSPLTFLLPPHSLPKSMIFQLHFKGIDFKTKFPPNQLSNFCFIDIKRCLMVLGNYGMNFRPGLKRERTQTNLSQIPQMKNGNLSRLPTYQKIETIFDFFPIIRRERSKISGMKTPFFNSLQLLPILSISCRV